MPSLRDPFEILKLMLFPEAPSFRCAIVHELSLGSPCIGDLVSETFCVSIPRCIRAAVLISCRFILSVQRSKEKERKKDLEQ